MLGLTVSCDLLGGPQMRVNKSRLLVAELVTITSTDPEPFFIKRVVANDNDAESGCTEASGVTLHRGEDHTVTFWRCGTISTVDVYTDRGMSSFKFNN